MFAVWNDPELYHPPLSIATVDCRYPLGSNSKNPDQKALLNI
jgi:hypothetical protein